MISDRLSCLLIKNECQSTERVIRKVGKLEELYNCNDHVYRTVEVFFDNIN